MENLLDSLFIDLDGVPKPNTELRTIGAIRDLIERDPGQMVNKTDEYGNVVKDENGKVIRVRYRKMAELELAYVYYTCKRNLWPGYTTEQRAIRIKLKVGLHETWQPDKVVLQAIEDLKEVSVSMQDKLLSTSRLLAQQFLDMIEEMITNNYRLITFFKRDYADLTPEEQERRTTEIKAAKEEISNSVDLVKKIEAVIKTIDEQETRRAVEEKVGKRKALGSTETDKTRYTRKAEADEDE